MTRFFLVWNKVNELLSDRQEILMNNRIVIIGTAMIGIISISFTLSTASWADKGNAAGNRHENIQLGPRPFFLVDDMDQGVLKKKLENCVTSSFKKSDFSIGHRGAPLQFPEHTRESYLAAAKMGAGILECDVTFTQDKELVCRHSQCDLHTTTNILETPLAERCSVPFQPAVFDDKGELVSPATAKCCTSDITLTEFKSLKGKMDAFDQTATSVNF